MKENIMQKTKIGPIVCSQKYHAEQVALDLFCLTGMRWSAKVEPDGTYTTVDDKGKPATHEFNNKLTEHHSLILEFKDKAAAEQVIKKFGREELWFPVEQGDGSYLMYDALSNKITMGVAILAGSATETTLNDLRVMVRRHKSLENRLNSGINLSVPTTNKAAAKLCEELAKHFRITFALPDYSAAGIKALERLIKDMLYFERVFSSPGFTPAFYKAAPAYFGQCLIKECGGKWIKNLSHEYNKENIAIQNNAGRRCYPVTKLDKYVNHGTEDSLYVMYLGNKYVDHNTAVAWDENDECVIQTPEGSVRLVNRAK